MYLNRQNNNRKIVNDSLQDIASQGVLRCVNEACQSRVSKNFAEKLLLTDHGGICPVMIRRV